MTTAAMRRTNGVGPKAKPTLGEFMQALAMAKTDLVRPEHWQGIVSAASGLNTTVSSEGGYLLEETVNDVLMRRIRDAGALLKHTSREPMAPDRFRVNLPYIDDKNSSGGSWTGVNATRLAPNAAIPASKILLGMSELQPDRIATVIPVTNELKNDVSMLENYTTTAVEAEVSNLMDVEILSGDGSGESLGILNSPATIQISKEVGQAAATVVADNLEKMAGRMLPSSFSNARWFTSVSAIPQLMKAATFTAPDTDAPAGRILTRPIVVCEAALPLGTVGDIVLADLAQYYVVEQPIVITFDPDFRFVQYESAWRFVIRIEGQPRLGGPVTPRYGSETVSPFITLATRA